MFVKYLSIKKNESYEKNPGQISGNVVLESPLGTQDIILSAQALSRIFAVIKEEVVDRSKKQAAAANTIMDEAIHSPLLTDASTICLLPADDGIPF